MQSTSARPVTFRRSICPSRIVWLRGREECLTEGTQESGTVLSMCRYCNLQTVWVGKCIPRQVAKRDERVLYYRRKNLIYEFRSNLTRSTRIKRQKVGAVRWNRRAGKHAVELGEHSGSSSSFLIMNFVRYSWTKLALKYGAQRNGVSKVLSERDLSLKPPGTVTVPTEQ